MAAILNSAMLDSDTSILDSNTLLSSLRFTQKHSPFTLNLTHTNSIWLTWWWQPSWILPFWIQPFCTKLWLKLVSSDSNSFILTELDNASHLEFCHLGFSHLSYPSQTHSHLPRLVPTICMKKTWLIHSDSTWWWQPSWILPSWIQPFCTKKNLTHSFSLNLMMAAILISAIMDSAILHKKNFTHSFWLKLMMAAILKSAILDSNTLLSSLRFTQKHSHSILNTTQTNSIWLKLIHSHLTWWWQPSWILPSWIQPS